MWSGEQALAKRTLKIEASTAISDVSLTTATCALGYVEGGTPQTKGRRPPHCRTAHRFITLQRLSPTLSGGLTDWRRAASTLSPRESNRGGPRIAKRRADCLRVNKTARANPVAVSASSAGARPPKPKSEDPVADYVARGLQSAVDQGFERVITNPDVLASVARLLIGDGDPVPRRRALPAAA